MALFLLSYLAGVLTILTPCILPILPFALVRAGVPFRQGGLPMLTGLVIAFAAVASLAAVAGTWAFQANRQGRVAALVVMTLVGLGLLLPGLAARLSAPLVSVGSRISDWAAGRRSSNRGTTMLSSSLIGVAMGLLWAPCAGPVLGLVLTGAALNGPGVETTLLLAAYAMGAATSLAAGLALSGRLLVAMRSSMRWVEAGRRVLGVAVLLGVAVITLGLDSGVLTRWSQDPTTAVERGLVDALHPAPVQRVPTAAGALSPPLRALLGAETWVNGPPLRVQDVRGKVVLVNFWTYSCINCLRALPYVRAWAERYRDRGLVVIGVHTPEFAFEKDLGNVSMASTQLGIGYPVVLDNEFKLWRAFDNRSWPALYFIGADGKLRGRRLGEGDYERSEQLLQDLLAESGERPLSIGGKAVAGIGTQAQADPRNQRSGETYIGFDKATDFAAPQALVRDARAVYQTIAPLPLNQWSLAGAWRIAAEYGTLEQAPGSLSYRFHARDLHLVLVPTVPGRTVRFRVTIDGLPPGASHGTDVDALGRGAVTLGRLYQLIRQDGRVEDRTFEIEFLDADVRVYAFTFG